MANSRRLIISRMVMSCSCVEWCPGDGARCKDLQEVLVKLGKSEYFSLLKEKSLLLSKVAKRKSSSTSSTQGRGIFKASNLKELRGG